MSEEIIENIETLIEEETTEKVTKEIVELPQRVNDFCVISKFTWENGGRDLQTNSGWGANPYGENYAIVPDEMVPDIMATQGYCDIVLNEDGTEVVEFTAREIPNIPEPPKEPTQEERITALEESLLLADETAVSLYESQLEQEEINMAQDEAIIEIYEMLGGV